MRRSMVHGVVLLLAVAAVAVHAHNWVGSPSRAKQAAVTKPCQMRVDTQPHIQVGVDQDFQMEWTMGHGDSNTKNFYWVALHADDYDQLLTATPAMFDDYIKNAPASAYTPYNGEKWKKWHLGQAVVGGVAQAPKERFGAAYGSQVPVNATNSPWFVPRDPVLSARKNTFGSANRYYQYRFYANQTANDVRVTYLNANYSWIESVHRFKNSFLEHETYANQFDAATFKLAGRKGPGDYIFYFYWGGYRDCVDIDLRSTAVTNRYGIHNTTAATSFVKVEHCQFYYMKELITPCQVVNRTTMSAQACLTACQRTGSCTGVQAVRVKNRAGTLPYTPGIPQWKFNATEWSSTFPPVAIGPCGSPDLHTRNEMGCKVVDPICNITKLKPADDDFICYGLRPYRDQDFQAIDDYIITNDAADPRFDSTCWIKVANTGFLDVVVPEKPVPAWDAGDSCVDCAFARAVKAAPLDRVTNWAKGMTTTCVNCDYPTK